MEPIRTNATLVDLLDRVLERGIIINADIIISLSGIPLIGIKLNAAIAGIETMLEYGMMRDWDATQRTIAEKDKNKEQLVVTGMEN